MSYIDLKHVTKVLKKNEVLSHISLSLEKGKIYGFYGRNASGKTMLFRAIAGLITLSSGQVTVDDLVIGKDCEFPLSLGLVIENTALWNELNGFENLKRLAAIQNKINNEQIRNTLLAVGLDPNDKRKYHKYSLGMKQKLAIAQAVMEKPDLIILDEPTNSLDEASVKQLKELIKAEQERGATILISSHIYDDLKELCHTIFKMENGCIIDREDGNGV